MLAAGAGVVAADEVDADSEIIMVSGTAPEQTTSISHELTADDLKLIAGAGNDVMRAVQVLPGVSRVPFSLGGLVLRGMSPRDTAVYLDGIEVPFAFHFGGVTSFYPSTMLDDLAITSGGFDASYGRAQGGIVTLTTREPRRDRWRVGGQLGLLDSAAHVEGPLPHGGGVLLGVRRSYFDKVLGPLLDDGTLRSSYWDFQIRTSWGTPERSGQITPMVFGSLDRIASGSGLFGSPLEVAPAVHSGFIRAAAPYRKQWGPLGARVVPWLGWNQFSVDNWQQRMVSALHRPKYLGGVSVELLRDYAWGHLRGGTEVTGGYQTHSSDEERSQLSWTNQAVWAETRWKIASERLAVKPAIRIERYGLSEQVVIDPRINIQQQLSEAITLRESAGRYHQPPTPGDVDPKGGNPSLDGSYMDQFSIALDSKWSSSTTASLTGFFHYGRGLGVEPSSRDPGSALWSNLGGLGSVMELLLEKEFRPDGYFDNLGRARSYGAEVSVRHQTERWAALASYTLSKAERVDDPQLGIGWRPFELDQRHNLNLAGSIVLGDWRFGARVQLVSGIPYSPTRVLGSPDSPGFAAQREPWAGRLPAYGVLDLRVDRSWQRCWGNVNAFIDVQNVTSRDNVEGRTFDAGLGRDRDIAGLPTIPFVGVELVPN
ncbi:MAG: TonB-dependent receptor plug domain-containing protein [Kofleriaceae bacterium]